MRRVARIRPMSQAAPARAAEEVKPFGVRRSSLQYVVVDPEDASKRWNVRGVAQPGRAPGSGPGGRRFKSSLPDHL